MSKMNRIDDTTLNSKDEYEILIEEGLKVMFIGKISHLRKSE